MIVCLEANDGRVTGLRSVLNPDKLAFAAAQQV